MFEEDTVDVACPNCERRNSIAVREFEATAEAHFVCSGCGAAVKIEGDEFRQRLEQVRSELAQLERDADKEARRKAGRPRKGDYQI